MKAILANSLAAVLLCQPAFAINLTQTAGRKDIQTLATLQMRQFDRAEVKSNPFFTAVPVVSKTSYVTPLGVAYLTSGPSRRVDIKINTLTSHNNIISSKASLAVNQADVFPSPVPEMLRYALLGSVGGAVIGTVSAVFRNLHLPVNERIFVSLNSITKCAGGGAIIIGLFIGGLVKRIKESSGVTP